MAIASGKNAEVLRSGERLGVAGPDCPNGYFRALLAAPSELSPGQPPPGDEWPLCNDYSRAACRYAIAKYA